MNFKNLLLFHTKNGEVYFTPSPLGNIALCMNFMRLVLNSYQSAFRCSTGSSGRMRYIQSDLTKYRRLLPQFASLYSWHYQYHPNLELFFRQYRDHQICGAAEYERRTVCSREMTCKDGFDDFISLLRHKAHGENHKKRAADWTSKLQKNNTRWLKLESELFRRHSTISFACVSLSYQASAFNTEELPQKVAELKHVLNKDFANYLDGHKITTLPSAKYSVSFEQLQADRNKLFGNLKGKTRISRQLAGYLWCIETNPISGYRLQVALFFSDTTPDETQKLATAFSQYWDNFIASTPGVSCVLDVQQLLRPMALGASPIGHQDQARRDALRELVIPELFGLGRTFNCRPYKQAHLFGTGLIRRSRPSLSSALVHSTCNREIRRKTP